MDPGTEQRRLLAEIIDRRRPEIEGRWLTAATSDAGRENVDLTALQDALPDYLAQLVIALRAGAEVTIETAGDAVWASVAREHGVTRVRMGFDVRELVHEFVVLRRVLFDALAAEEVAHPGLRTLATEVIEAAIAAAVTSYVDARDFEARRREAEHVAFITHELRNPLTTAMMASSTLKRSLGPDQARVVERMERAHHRLEQLITTVLIAERMEAESVEPRPVDVTLGELFEGSLVAARGVATEKRLALRAAYDARLRVRVDPLLTTSAIQNLVDNAVTYTDHGEVEIVAEDTQDDVTIHVRDTCDGLSDEELRTIFEPFRRGSTRKPGTGVGLSIARRAIEVQGGSIHGESLGEVGCHFWFTLPKAPRDKAGTHGEDPGRQ